MKVIHHIAISAGVSAVVWFLFHSIAAMIACFLTGILLDIDHIIDYIVNYGWKVRVKHLFQAFEYEVFENIFVFLHSWEFVIIYLALLWFIDWKPVALGAGIGILAHLAADHLFNDHSPLGYFLSYRIRHGFSAKYFYGAPEYRKRLKHQRAKSKN